MEITYSSKEHYIDAINKVVIDMFGENTNNEIGDNLLLLEMTSLKLVEFVTNISILTNTELPEFVDLFSKNMLLSKQKYVAAISDKG